MDKVDALPEAEVQKAQEQLEKFNKWHYNFNTAKKLFKDNLEGLKEGISDAIMFPGNEDGLLYGEAVDYLKCFQFDEEKLDNLFAKD